MHRSFEFAKPILCDRDLRRACNNNSDGDEELCSYLQLELNCSDFSFLFQGMF